MNFSIIRYILSSVLAFEGIFLLLPCAVGAIYGEREAFAYLFVAALSICFGFLGRVKKPKSKEIYSKGGLVTVSFSWILLSLVGAVPFVLTGEIPRYEDALFEVISGLTTTGASILNDVEAISRCTAFWRCFTHWIGGMGVLVLILAILPLSGSYNMHLMRAESPGPSVGKLVPKVRQTAMILYAIYGVITVVEIVALIIAGLPLFDAATLTFATVGTGGFGLLNSSIASYSLAIQIIFTVFMLLSSINFSVYYLILVRKAGEAFRFEEMRWFLAIVFGSALLITFNIKDGFDSLFMAFHTALFQVATVISTTGFATVDFNLWPEFSKSVLLFLMFVGACAGSTGGGFKVSRLMLLARSIKNEIICVAHPRTVKKVHMNGRMMSETVLKTVHVYLGAYVMILIVSVILISIDGFDLETNFSAVMATLNNIGPGFGKVGPTGNFSGFSVFSKVVLMFDMLAGRLELFPILALFHPGIWQIKYGWRSDRGVSEQEA